MGTRIRILGLQRTRPVDCRLLGCAWHKSPMKSLIWSSYKRKLMLSSCCLLSARGRTAHTRSSAPICSHKWVRHGQLAFTHPRTSKSGDRLAASVGVAEAESEVTPALKNAGVEASQPENLSSQDDTSGQRQANLPGGTAYYMSCRLIYKTDRKGTIGSTFSYKEILTHPKQKKNLPYGCLWGRQWELTALC